MYIKCCVPGCDDKISSRHRFPDPKTSRYKEWLEAIKNQELFSLDGDVVRRNKRVCHRHFEKTFYTEGAKRLHLNAIPTLHLPMLENNVEPTSSGVNNVVEVTDITQNILEMPQTEEALSFNVNVEDHTVVEDGVITDAQSPIQVECNKEENLVVNDSQTTNSNIKKKKRGSREKYEMTPHKMLKSAGINIRKDMTPRKQKLYSFVKSISRKFQRSNSSKQNFKSRLFEAEKFSQEKGLEENISVLNKVARQFIRCQIREAGKSPKQHRFTVDEKIMSLALYKQNPKTYRFLSMIFTLPSKSTLNIFLNEINFEAGINDNIFDSLKSATDKLDPSDKYISLIWDEMSIMPSLNFQEKKGYIEGFGDMGENDRNNEIADHVLVFMVRGLKKKFKQPISYTFSIRGGVKAVQLKKLLKIIISKLLEINLKPIVTICDQATTNVAVLNSLIRETKTAYLKQKKEYRGGYFEIMDFQIYPIFDPPHLLKGIRNNFIDKCIKFGPEHDRKMAKWEHIKNLYERDNAPNTIDGLRALPHLTDEHIYKNKIKKMKVKYAAQIFSQRLASTLKLASQIDIYNTLGEGAGETAELLYFFDRLFDSVNGSQKFPIHGKTLRCGISEESDHIRFWTEEAIPMLSSMEFIVNGQNEQSKPPSLKNWIFTLKNIINIWNILKHKGFEYILGRHLNQDPLENMFGQVRSYGIRYTNPNSSAFIGIFKTIVVNSAINIYKPTFSCENDECETLFDGLKLLFNDTRNRQEEPPAELKNSMEDGTVMREPEYFINDIGEQTLQLELSQLVNNYVAGFIIKKIKKRVLSCTRCEDGLFVKEVGENDALITAREYLGGWSKRLCYPTSQFADCFFKINEYIKKILKMKPHDKNLVSYIKQNIRQSIDFSFLKCDEHKSQIIAFICNISCRTLIHAWCKDVNRILTGKDSRPNYGYDMVKKNAHNLYVKRKKKPQKH